MTLTYGFFNSFNGDRRYDAQDFSSIFDGIINDGVFMSVGNNFFVTANGEDLVIDIDTGRAWLNHTWTYNDSIYQISMPASELNGVRIDCVYLEVNNSDEVRKNGFYVKKGDVVLTNPQRPTLINDGDIHQYALAYIYREANTDSIRQADVTNVVGVDPLPYVTGILQVIDAGPLLEQWSDQFTQWYEDEKEVYYAWIADTKQEHVDWISAEEQNFLDWFNSIKGQLTGDAATALLVEVNKAVAIGFGFTDKITTFNPDGSITEVGPECGTKTTFFQSDGSIVEHLIYNGVTKVKTTTFEGSVIREVIAV